MSNKSIYETIRENIVDGRLPRNFELPHEETSPNELKFMVGAKDGIGVHHMGETDAYKTAVLIVRYLKGGVINKIESLVSENGALQLVDDVLSEIQRLSAKLDFASILKYAQSFAFESSDEEMVKLGIAILGLFDWSDSEEMQEKFITLGLYEEFTLYSVVAVQNWTNGNDVVFKIAKGVDGWGKIHAVERLEPTSDEIRNWILTKGCENAVMDAYLGLECATKGDLIGALRAESLTPELYESIAIVIEAMLDEGPVEGISAYEFAEEALSHYVEFSKDYAISLKHLWHMLNLRDTAEDLELPNKDELIQACNAIINQTKWIELIKASAKDSAREDFFYAANTSNRMDIDIDESIFTAIKANPLKKSSYLPWVYKNADYARELTALYEAILPLEKMATGMGDYIFATDYRQEHNTLDSILQELKAYPNMGESLVMAALKSPVTRERNGACGVLSAWREKLGQSVAAYSPKFYQTLSIISKEEVNDDTKNTMIELLENES